MRHLHLFTACAFFLSAQITTVSATESSAATADNPLLTESTLPYRVPPFDKIKHEHFAPAIVAGMREQLKEVGAVANHSDKPTLDNTIVRRDRTGRLLDRAKRALSHLNGCNTNPAMHKT